ncbi:MAG: hypothetical protein ACO1RX_20130 [Candidatus Sericytochromatia bacterium]
MQVNDIVAQKLVEKGILTAEDLAGGAELNAEQREALADLTIESSALNEHATVEKIYDKWEYDALELSGRYAELDNGSTSSGRKPSTIKVKLEPVPVKAVLRLQKSYLRRLATKRIAPEQKAEILMGALGTVIMNDAERMVYYSNEHGPSITEKAYKNDGTGSATDRVKDATFSEFNGIIATADKPGSQVKTYNANNSSDMPLIMHEMIKRLDPGYRDTEKEDLRFYVPSNLEENLRSLLKNRKTQYGDLILTEDEQVKFRGIMVAPLPLLDLNPTVTEHITMNGTTPVNLLYKPLPSASDFFLMPEDLEDEATTPFVGGGDDFTLNTTNATVVLPGSGSEIGNTETVKATYRTLPQIFLTKKTNFLIGIGVDDMEQESQYFANPGILELVGRTQVATKFIKEEWVVRAINIQDAVAATT